jgi:hypothetical protein
VNPTRTPDERRCSPDVELEQATELPGRIPDAIGERLLVEAIEESVADEPKRIDDCG